MAGEGRGARPGAGGRGKHRPPPRPVEVLAVERVTARMVSVTFAGDSLEGFGPPKPTAHVKVFLPEADGKLVLPVAGPDGGAIWPEGHRAVARTYTPRRFDPSARTLEVHFLLHGEGPASRWAAQAAVGQRVAIGGPGGRFEVDESVRTWWIAGDESAIPAIATLLEALPETARAEVHIEVDDRHDEVDLESRADLTVSWHHRRTTEWGAELEEAARAADIPAATAVWVGCEAQAVRRLRSLFLAERGHPAALVTTRGYWRRGEANHPDHDYGED